MRTRSLLCSLLASIVLTAVGCGGGPSVPSVAKGVSLDGTAIGLPAVATGSVRSSARGAAAEPVVTMVCQENPAITGEIGTDGLFTLRGLPEGGFTLDFFLDGEPFGVIRFDAVKPNQQITITVDVSGATVTLLEERRNGIGHGDLEIEGIVQAADPVDSAGESRFVIEGYVVVARPGDTTIREGNAARTVEDVTVGRQVHVKGVWLSDAGTPQPVLAWEIKLQDADDGGGERVGFRCEKGGKAEVEGIITATDGVSSLEVEQQGKGVYLCQVGEGTRIRKGNTEYDFADLRPGWRVHVKGTERGLDEGRCQVDASEVKVQRT